MSHMTQFFPGYIDFPFRSVFPRFELFFTEEGVAVHFCHSEAITEESL